MRMKEVCYIDGTYMRCAKIPRDEVVTDVQLSKESPGEVLRLSKEKGAINWDFCTGKWMPSP